jgi:hypothetical protein
MTTPISRQRMTPAAVLFDADGVIQRAPADLHSHLAHVLGAAPSDREACMADYFAAESPCLTGSADFAEALGPVLAKWKTTSGLAAVLAAWQVIEVDHASHTSERLAYRKMFDREFYSCHLGHMKLSPDYFHEIVRLAALDPRPDAVH